MMAGAASAAPERSTAGAVALLRNDARTLLPFWIAGIGAATLAGFTARVGVDGVRRLLFADPHALSVVASIALIVALGAQSLGHEYSDRTLGLLLALPMSRRQIYPTLITTAVSLYISSLCSSGMRATVASLIAIPSSLWLVGVAVTALGRTDFLFWRGHGAAWLTLALMVVALLLGLSLTKHRPELPEPARIRIQLLTIAAVIGTGVLLVTAVG